MLTDMKNNTWFYGTFSLGACYGQLSPKVGGNLFD
jgi:hypothetical protein